MRSLITLSVSVAGCLSSAVCAREVTLAGDCIKRTIDLTGGHREAPDLFIDCTFETAGKLQLMDYGISMHADGDTSHHARNPPQAVSRDGIDDCHPAHIGIKPIALLRLQVGFGVNRLQVKSSYSVREGQLHDVVYVICRN